MELALDSANSASCAAKLWLEKFISSFRCLIENLNFGRHELIRHTKAHPNTSRESCCQTSAHTPNPVKAIITPTTPLISVEALLEYAIPLKFISRRISAL